VISSTNFIGMDIGNVLSPILGSMVVEKYGYKTMYWGYGILTLAASLAIYLLIKVMEKKRLEA
jgi:predicted MFS family arabinose efflux permease